MDNKQLKDIVPSVFTKSPNPKLSQKYVFVDTHEMISGFESEGWSVSSARQRGKGIYASHEIRMRNGSFPKVGDTFLEAILSNSHDGTTKFSVSAGLHRLACSNGLTVPTSVSESFSLRHKGFNIGEIKRITDGFATKLPLIEKSVEKMKIKILTEEEMFQFAKNALEFRWQEGSVPKSLDIVNLLTPKRQEDEDNDMWSVFNRVQENFVRGGLGYTSNNGKNVKMRELKNFMAINKINTNLWELAESMC